METILEETVATEDLKKFEQKYHVELNNGKVNELVFVLLSIAHVCREDWSKCSAYLCVITFVQVSSESQFEYAWCLVRSRYPADIRKGIILLEDLFQVSLEAMFFSSKYLLGYL